MSVLAENKRVFFDNEILEKYEAGIELFGFEVKAAKDGRMNIQNAHAIIRGGEMWLVNSEIPAFQPKNAPAEYDTSRARRLLLHRGEISSLTGKIKEKGLTLLPIRVYIKNQRLKIELGLARRKKKIDQREAIKKREVERDMRRALK